MDENWMPEIVQAEPTPGWKPAVPFDLMKATSATFTDAVNKIKEWAKAQPWTPLDIRDAWYRVTPELAEQLLLRNRHNRDMRFPDVVRYAGEMKRDRWMLTGEPIIVTTKGFVEDAGHRLTACYFGNVPFISKVVVVPHNEELFAVIDNGVSRNGADSLATAGVGEGSALLAKVIQKIAIPYDEGCLMPKGKSPVVLPVSNRDVLAYTQQHPDLIEIEAMTRELYPLQCAILKPENCTFLNWQIDKVCETEAREQFMQDLLDEGLPSNNPIACLRVRLEENEQAKLAAKNSPKAALKLGSNMILALAIKAFNESQKGRTLRRLDLRMSEPFPRIEGAASEMVAAE